MLALNKKCQRINKCEKSLILNPLNDMGSCQIHGPLFGSFNNTVSIGLNLYVLTYCMLIWL